MISLEELEQTLNEIRNDLKESLTKRLQHSDRLVIAINRQFNDIKNIKSSDLILFKDIDEQYTLGDILIEYKVLVKLVEILLLQNDEHTKMLETKYNHLANQFVKLLELYKGTSQDVEIIKTEVF